MKNKIRLIGSLLIVCLLITGCNGTITKNIRHDGYNVQDGKFSCSIFTEKSEEENANDTVKFLTDNYIISDKGYIYEINIGGLFSNNMNCRKPGISASTTGATISTKVVAILDQSIVKGQNGYLYYLDSNDNAVKYTRVPNNDKEMGLYKILLGEPDIVKVVTVNSNIHNYYVLKKDGAIYNYVVDQDENTDKYKMTKIPQPVIGRDVYGPIIDFNYEGDSFATYYRTEDKIITKKIKNEKECNKYVDIPCEFEEAEDETLIKYQDRIIAFNGKTIITDYGRIFTAGS